MTRKRPEVTAGYAGTMPSFNRKTMYLLALVFAVGAYVLWQTMYSDNVSRLYNPANDDADPMDAFKDKPKYMCICGHMCPLAGPYGDIGLTACQCVAPKVGPRKSPSPCGCDYCAY